MYLYFISVLRKANLKSCYLKSYLNCIILNICFFIIYLYFLLFIYIYLNIYYINHVVLMYILVANNMQLIVIKFLILFVCL